ncbi:aldo/keto reductase [Peribacillus sp. SCS-155]|uniref:aldo/keto reductase n=1 Tax=Peribacillus sedimenti TaxID=3115297 RepID=UPI00390611E6
MARSLEDCTTLHNGVQMPWFGLGVYKVNEGQEVVHAVKTAINLGYRSIDTASFYKNEEGVGQAIKEAGAPRDQLFLTTKVWNTEQGFDSTLASYEQSIKKLGVDYVDLYLIHWPVSGKYIDTWKALEKLYKEGRVRAIGVSNFHIHHLEKLLEEAEIIPMVNQVEYHPLLNQNELHAFCKTKSIQLEAWSPLMRGHLFDHPVLREIAEDHHKTVAQIVLRWDLQNEVVTIPKSIHEQRITENADIFDFELTPLEMDKINSLNENRRIGSNPDDF